MQQITYSSRIDEFYYDGYSAFGDPQEALELEEDLKDNIIEGVTVNGQRVDRNSYK